MMNSSFAPKVCILLYVPQLLLYVRDSLKQLVWRLTAACISETGLHMQVNVFLEAQLRC